MTEVSELSAIFDQAPLAMALVEMNAEGRCVFTMVNAGFRHLFGLGQAPMLNEQVSSLFQETDSLAIGALLRPEVQRMSLHFETAIQKGEGDRLPCLINARTVVGGELKRVLITAECATTNGNIDEGARKEAGDQQREDFIATLTHDLKTPIVGANMVLTALLDGSLGEMLPAQAEIIHKLRTSNQALLKMIQNLLEVYKYESGTESLRFDGANLSDIVRFCVEDTRPLIENKNISLEVMCDKPELLLICDEYAIKRVLINLLSNAVKFTPEGGQILIKAFEDAEFAHLIVKDTGRGISALDKECLFQRFWQGEPGRRYAAGTGLGLYFCHNVVKAHGGKIECESLIGAGTTFTIALPKHVYAK